MKVTLDTEKKTVAFYTALTIREVIDIMKDLRPSDWVDYKVFISPEDTTPYRSDVQVTPLSGKYPHNVVRGEDVKHISRSKTYANYETNSSNYKCSDPWGSWNNESYKPNTDGDCGNLTKFR